MRRVTVALLAVGLAGTACRKEKKPEPAAPAAAEAESQPKPSRPPMVKRTLTALTVAEAAPLLASPEGARQTKAPAAANNGTRVVASWCFDHGELESLSKAVEGTLTNAGWTGVNLRQNQRVPERVNLAARKDTFVLTGALERGTFADCDGAKGQTQLTLNVHKQTPRPASLLPVGPRATQGMRPLGGQRGPLINPPVRLPPVAPDPTTSAPASPGAE